MNTVEKNRLSQEVKLQMNALQRISRWKTTAIALSTLGVALTYAGFASENHGLFLGILGILIILLGVVSAVVLNLGLRNGRRNVEKMLNLLRG